MNVIKISVIISIFNGEKDIKVLLNSLKKQEIQDIEYILIDNGSLDRTQEICREYAASDKRFRVEVIEQNIGYIQARNYGLTICRGEYVTFADADDRVAEGAYVKMYETASAKNADWLIAPYFQENKQGESVLMPLRIEEGTYQEEEIKKNILPAVFGYDKNGVHINGFMWRMLFKRALIQRLENRFTEDVKPLEDELFNQKIAAAAKVVTVLNIPVYYYKVNPESVTAKAAKDFEIQVECKKNKLFFEKSIENMHMENLPKEIEESIYQRLFFSLYVLCLNVAKICGGKESKEKAKVLEEYFPKDLAERACISRATRKLSFYDKIICHFLKKGKYAKLIAMIKIALKLKG